MTQQQTPSDPPVITILTWAPGAELSAEELREMEAVILQDHRGVRPVPLALPLEEEAMGAMEVVVVGHQGGLIPLEVPEEAETPQIHLQDDMVVAIGEEGEMEDHPDGVALQGAPALPRVDPLRTQTHLPLTILTIGLT